MKTLRLEEVDSTNSYVKRNAENLESLTWVTATTQSGGRGQRGNSWESEPGKNLTFSLFWRPERFPAREQFAISEATALAVRDLLGEYGIDATVKWPNDIYVGDRKICGILIEHSLMGSDILYTIIGAGVNVNQERFISDAPNPVSIRQILSKEIPLDEIEQRAMTHLEDRLRQISDPEGKTRIHRDFLACCYRHDGEAHPFRDAASGEVFPGVIENIDPQGYMKVRNTVSGETKTYAFKEVSYII